MRPTIAAGFVLATLLVPSPTRAPLAAQDQGAAAEIVGLEPAARAAFADLVTEHCGGKY